MPTITSAKFIFFGLIALTVILEIIADILLKKWSIDGKEILLYIGLFLYLVGTIFWAISLKYEYLSKAISIFAVLNLAIIAFVGMLFFNENLSLINKIGIGFGVLSVILVEI